MLNDQQILILRFAQKYMNSKNEVEIPLDAFNISREILLRNLNNLESKGYVKKFDRTFGDWWGEVIKTI